MGRKTYLIVTLLVITLFQINFALANNETVNSTSTEIINDPTININILDKTVNLGEEIEFEISIEYDENILYVKIDYGNDYSKILDTEPYAYYSEEYEYSNTGSYRITVTVKTENGESFTKTSQTIKIEEPIIPDERPTITLVSPSDKITSKQDKMTFNFKANDDYTLKQCTFELYKKDGSIKKLEYEKTYEAPEKNKEISVSLEQFEDANYSWYVTCEDNKSQEKTASREFEIKTVNHEREKEILYFLESIDNFLEQESKMSLDEKNAIEELGIIDDVKYYKKRLIQINQDLGNNIKYISDKTLREKRKAENHEELDEIIKKIPTSIKVLESQSYSKNSLTTSMENIILRYIETQNLELSSRKIKNLVKSNIFLQEKFSADTSFLEVEIEYNNTSEKIGIIKKSFRTSDPNQNIILEVFPENFNKNIEFISPVQKLENNIYKININELEKDEIIYYIKEHAKINEIKNTETILFEESQSKSNGITGFAVFEEGINQNSIVISIAASILLILALNFRPRKKKFSSNWKSNENAKNVIEWIKKGKEEIKQEHIAEAKEYYHKIKQSYNLLPEKFKNEAYSEIENLRIDIDKKEIRDFIREYENAKKEGRTTDSNKLYKQIADKYKKLPKKYQQKIYERIMQ